MTIPYLLLFSIYYPYTFFFSFSFTLVLPFVVLNENIVSKRKAEVGKLKEIEGHRKV